MWDQANDTLLYISISGMFKSVIDLEGLKLHIHSSFFTYPAIFKLDKLDKLQCFPWT